MNEKNRNDEIPSNDIPVYDESEKYDSSEGIYETHDDASNEDILTYPSEEKLYDKSLRNESYAQEAYENKYDKNSSNEEDDARARTKKKQKMIKMIGAGVAVLFISVAFISSWMKAKEMKASQIQEDVFNEAQNEQTTTPVQPQQTESMQQDLNIQPTVVSSSPVIASSSSVVASSSPVVTSLTQEVNQQFAKQPDPSVVMQQNEDIRAHIEELRVRVAAIENKLLTMNATNTHHVLNNTTKSKPKKKKTPENTVQQPRSDTNETVVQQLQTETQSSKTTEDSTINKKPDEITLPAVVSTAPVENINPCKDWIVKGAIPGMAWIENNGKIEPVKIGDKIGNDIGNVISIDSVNFEVKTKTCTIR